VRWYLSIDRHDLPFEAEPGRPATHRVMTVDGKDLAFSEGFGDLHTAVYREILAGRGFGVTDARPAINLVHAIRTALPVAPTSRSHEKLRR
jgi:UDP-N-acetyl-2-amino-2-deoxyglucuronate dehydrogenase